MPDNIIKTSEPKSQQKEECNEAVKIQAGFRGSTDITRQVEKREKHGSYWDQNKPPRQLPKQPTFSEALIKFPNQCKINTF